MFDNFLIPWSSFLFKNEEPENKVQELESIEPDAGGRAVESKLKVNESLNSVFSYSHGLPPKPYSNRSFPNALRRKRGSLSSSNKGDLDNILASGHSACDAVVPGSQISPLDGSEGSGDLRGLSSNFQDFNILAKEGSQINLTCQGRASEREQDQQVVSKYQPCLLPCAKELGPGGIPQSVRKIVFQMVRCTVARVIRRVTGLSLSTVEKWFSLLSHFLELSAEEQLMFLIFLRKYLKHNGPLREGQDSLRPQKWERVLALCAYFSVWLSEEFAARTREDLVTLMGPRFHFGKEQKEFLIAVDWRIYIGYDEYCHTLEMFLIPDEMQRGVIIWEWLGYSTLELTESLDVRREVILSNLTRHSTVLSAGRKRQPMFLPDEKETTEEGRRFFRKMALGAFLSSQGHDVNAETNPYLCVPNG
ncbi:uncharacterized protein Gasu_64410 [Galdieria sulphuraria]|uniref:Uncharacterized protein n=1 Tax=Galdieria sulphuraria TaxID=130081 RepID=M2XQL3_GALSU|nr:uncharacterized protein Gasu_64410 [Galdieria sulphuraria]EME25898.1 hypothetical protein Gasu_64410 [Galdieria sulphuraria]|eukprot:XP_005702418.1 hypothetical protein Gasu_64410 [Galdieria sulphuraria]